MKLSDRLEIQEHVVARDVDGELMLLDMTSGTYFNLDQVGAKIWRLLEEGHMLSAVCTEMMSIFEVTREDIERDVLALAEKLAQQQLIRPVPVEPS